MTNHKATTRQWSGIERFVRYGAYDSCIIELRDRVEALEAAAKPAESNCQETLDSSLVELVADAIYSNATGGVREEARAAILAVADWLDQQELHIAATLVRQEVGQ
jgi:hypothetical protein